MTAQPNPEATDEIPWESFFATLRKEQYPHLDKITYLDYTASAPYPTTLLQKHTETLLSTHLANPHSESAPSAQATALIEDTKRQVLTFFRADEHTYDVIFTANATSAAKLVGESFPFRRGSRLVLTQDNHNSIVGMRQFAERKRASVSYIPLDNEFGLRDIMLPAPRQPSLFAYPAQSNFSGVIHPSLVAHARERGYAVLLDASALVGTSRLDLRAQPADFVTLSFYKMFGYPTGVGALLVRRDALARLQRPWFAGGTVEWVTTVEWPTIPAGRHALFAGADGFADGTPDFLAIPAVGAGLRYLSAVGMGRIGAYVRALTALLVRRLGGVRDARGGCPVRVLGPQGAAGRGAAVTFDLVLGGLRVKAMTVERELAREGVCVRAGCFCNPGCGEHALGIGAPRRARRKTDEGVPNVKIGFVRTSLGAGAVREDVERLVQAVQVLVARMERGEVDDVFWEFELRQKAAREAPATDSAGVRLGLLCGMANVAKGWAQPKKAKNWMRDDPI